MKYMKLLLLLVVTLTTVGCGVMFETNNKELTRAKAQKLLNSSEKFALFRSYIFISDQEIDCGARAGLWDKGMILTLTPNGKAEFDEVSFRVNIGQHHVGEGGDLLFKKVLKRHAVEILGIRDLPGGEGKQKSVEFSWSFDMDDWSPIVKPCFPPGPPRDKGKATFALYDDGWRVEQVQ